MATEDVVSASITNRDASPRVPSALYVGGRSFMKREVVHMAVADVGSTYKFFDLPSNAVVTSAKITTSADAGTTTTVQIGLNRTVNDGAAVVDENFFSGDALSLKDGALTKSEFAFLNVITVAHAKYRIWEHLALTTDPQIDYDVVMTTDGACDGAADVLIEIEYKLN